LHPFNNPTAYMNSSKRIHLLAGWLVFAVAATVYYLTAERTGSLWDCGEFILGAYKLQVVHPPGAPLFLLVGRLFTWVATLVSDNPEDIAFSVNLMSGICTAFTAAFVAWVTMTLGKMTLVGRDEELDLGQTAATAGAGIIAGLATAFCSSIWFSAVEGEVYAMSTFFTALTLWTMIKWYSLPDTPQADRWLVLTVYAAGLSMGVHLLSLLTFPALAIFYYYKKYTKHTFLGMAVAAGIGVVIISVVQKLIIVGIPILWSSMELLMVNGFGLPFHTGLIPTLLIVGGLIYFGLYMAHKRQNALLQNVMVALTMLVISFSTIGVVLIRANAEPPVNMNAPNDAMRLIPYLNREQYGERALLYGPHFDAKPKDTEITDRYGRVGDHYEITDYKIDLVYDDKDKILFPRMSDNTQGRPDLYRRWMDLPPNSRRKPDMGDNIKFMFQYQLGWMYWRYFMWNFSGRQNGEQGFEPWDKSSGHWISGIKALDAARLGNQDKLPDTMKNNKARNVYYMLPFLFGLLGLFFHFQRRPNEALGLLALFVITGIGIVIYSNQPPNEPRERDYVLVGSFFTYCIWIGFAVIALYQWMNDLKVPPGGVVTAMLSTALVFTAPYLMLTQNYDDHTRSEHKGSRDYATNFLESCAPNAIIFTYGDNDTYPLWYAQEVEKIRTDVRVVNLSLIAVDWYIDLLRRKVNDSAPIKMTIPIDAYRGKQRNQVFYYGDGNREMSLQEILTFIGSDASKVKLQGRDYETFPTKNAYLSVNREAALKSGAITAADTGIVDRIPLNLNKDQLLKDDLAVLDIIGSNLWERPIYFAVTCRPEKLFGLDDYMQLEGLGIRIVPVKTASDPSYGMIGKGRVNTEAMYKNVMEKFRWGNFDNKELFVDRSYAPSVQGIQLAMRRVAFTLLRENKKTEALAIIDKYFTSFPHMNFPYDYRTMYMLSVYFQADAYDKAKPHLEILAKQTQQYLAYYASVPGGILDSSYRNEFDATYQTMQNIMAEARRAKDEPFVQELEKMFSNYISETPPAPERDPLLD